MMFSERYEVLDGADVSLLVDTRIGKFRAAHFTLKAAA
jgi:hypothetical protein